MARGLLRITDADLVVTVTGVGGPDPEEGHPAGTVYICTGDSTEMSVVKHRFSGPPAEVVAQATDAALNHLATAARMLARRETTV
jgi:nicotinamide mononucleotide (NMN) deamidase PncC